MMTYVLCVCFKLQFASRPEQLCSPIDCSLHWSLCQHFVCCCLQRVQLFVSCVSSTLIKLKVMDLTGICCSRPSCNFQD